MKTQETSRTDAERTTAVMHAKGLLDSGIDQSTAVRIMRMKYKTSRATAYRDVKQAISQREGEERFTPGGPLEARDRLLVQIRFTLAKVTMQIEESEEINPQLIQLQLKLTKQEKDLLAMGGHGAGYNSPKPDPVTESIINTHKRFTST